MNHNNLYQQNNSTSDEYSSPMHTLEALPDGWDMYTDATTGWPFFVDHNSQTTTWQDPRSVRHAPYPRDRLPHVKVREIPIIHESERTVSGGGDDCGQRNQSTSTTTRQIPIQREEQPLHQQQQQWPPTNHRGWPDRQPMGDDDFFDGGLRFPPSAHDMFRPNFGIPDCRYRPSSGGSGFGVPVVPTLHHPAAATSRFDSRSNGAGSPVTVAPQQPTMDASTHHQQQRHPSPPKTVQEMEIPIIYESSPSSTEAEKSVAPAADKQTTETVAAAASHTLSAEQQPPQRGRSPSPAPPLTPLESIAQILAETEQLRADVESFIGRRGEKPYVMLEELLTRLLIKLDLIDSEGRDDIRAARREAVRTVQTALDLLESRAAAPPSVDTLVAENAVGDAGEQQEKATSMVPEAETMDVEPTLVEGNASSNNSLMPDDTLAADIQVAESAPVSDGQTVPVASDEPDSAAVEEMTLNSEVTC